MFTNQEYKLHFQSSRTVYVKIDILNKNDITIYQLETEAIDGGISIDAQRPARRECDLQLVYKPRLMPSESSPIWLNKKMRIWIGIRSFIDDNIYYFNRGVFSISNGDINISLTEKTLQIKGLDKSAFLDGNLSGQLENKIIIDAGTPIHMAVRSTVSTLGGENKLLIDTHDYPTPYRIEKNANDTVWGVLDELTKLYMSWQCYYDVNGYFNFNKIRNKLDDPIAWNFNDKDIRINNSVMLDFSNIKNNYIVYGKLKDDGIQVKASYQITKMIEPESPFTIEEIDKRTLIISEDKYWTNEACQQRLEYEKFLHTNFNERIRFSCLPIYFLDVNQVIYLDFPEENTSGRYVVDKINLNLKYDSLMNIEAYKIY